MSARKKGKPAINLLPREEFETSLGGRILKWGVTSFRYIVIFTEIIVMGAFLSRFWLDTEISDLNDELEQKQAIIASYSTLEQDFRSAQNRLAVYSFIKEEGVQYLGIVETMANYLPDEVSLQTITNTKDGLEIKGQSLSEESVEQYIANLESTNLIESIDIKQIQNNNNQPFIDFTLVAENNGS